MRQTAQASNFLNTKSLKLWKRFAASRQEPKHSSNVDNFKLFELQFHPRTRSNGLPLKKGAVARIPVRDFFEQDRPNYNKIPTNVVSAKTTIFRNWIYRCFVTRRMNRVISSTLAETPLACFAGRQLSAHHTKSCVSL